MDGTDARFSTGIRFLDMELGGGVPVGDLVALTTPPDAQSEVIFKELARVQRLLYVSTICPDESELRRWVEPVDGDAESEVSVTYLSPTSILDDPSVLVDEITADTCLIIDPIDPLEAASREAYLSVLNAVGERLRAVESIGFLNCLETETDSKRRSLTLKRADHIWNLRQSLDGGELMTQLLISKARGHSVPQEAISIELDEQVQIDTSRNIA